MGRAWTLRFSKAGCPCTVTFQMTTAGLGFPVSCHYNLSVLEHICICLSCGDLQTCLYMHVQGADRMRL